MENNIPSATHQEKAKKMKNNPRPESKPEEAEEILLPIDNA